MIRADTILKHSNEAGIFPPFDSPYPRKIEEVIRKYSPKSGHNFKKKFFINYFSETLNLDDDLSNLYEYIKFRLINSGNNGNVEYLRLKYNCKTEDDLNFVVRRFRLDSIPKIEAYIKKYGKEEGEEKYKLSVNIIDHLPYQTKSLYDFIYASVKVSKLSDKDKETVLLELNEIHIPIDLQKKVSEIVKKNKTNFMYKLVTYFNEIFHIEHSVSNLMELLKLPRTVSMYFSVKGVSLRHNCNEEEAKEKAEYYKKFFISRDVDSFIARYGEVEGVIRYQKFVKKIEPYLSRKKFNKLHDAYEWDLKVANPMCFEYYVHRGLSKREARDVAFEYRQFHCLPLGGYGLVDKNRILKNDSLAMLKQKFPDNWREIYKKRLESFQKYSKIKDDLYDDYQIYRREVDRLTEHQIILYGERVEGFSNLHKDGFVLDHKFSVYCGYLANINPEVISHFTNLRFVTKSENSRKTFFCEKDINKLFQDYYMEMNNEN